MSTDWNHILAVTFAGLGAVCLAYALFAFVRMKYRRPWISGLDSLLAFDDDVGLLACMSAKPDWTKHGTQDERNMARLARFRCLYSQDRIEMLSFPGAVMRDVSSRDVRVTDKQIRVRVFEPTRSTPGEPAPLVLFFYCGGMVIGGVDGETLRPKYIAQKLGAIVASIEYPLAPEHRFPQQNETALSAAEHIIRNPRSLGVDFDASRVVTYGFSAGGYLAFMTALSLAEKGIALRGHFAQHPMGPPEGSPSRDRLRHTSIGWSGDADEWAWDQILQGTDPSEHNTAKVHALFASDAQLAKISPGFVTFGSYDVCRDADEAYAEKLRGVGKLLGCKEYAISHVSFRSTWQEEVNDVIEAMSGVLATATTGGHRRRKGHQDETSPLE